MKVTKMFVIFVIFVIFFPIFSFANVNSYQGEIAGKNIELYIDDSRSPELDVFYVIKETLENISLVLDYDRNNLYFDELDSWTLYNQTCYNQKEKCSFIKLDSIELNNDLETLKNIELNGYWFNAVENKKYYITLKRESNINDDEDVEFNDIELLQRLSTNDFYFTVNLSKNKNDLVKVIGVNVYSKKDRKLIQKLDNLNYFYNSFYSIEIDDYNFDGIPDFAVSKTNILGMQNKEYDYYVYDNHMFIKLPLSGFNFVFDKKSKLAKSEKLCSEQKNDITRTITTIADYYIFRNNKFIYLENTCDIYDENSSKRTHCTKNDYDACLAY